MRFRDLEVINEANMGATALANVSPTNMTFGFEFEIASKYYEKMLPRKYFRPPLEKNLYFRVVFLKNNKNNTFTPQYGYVKDSKEMVQKIEELLDAFEHGEDISEVTNYLVLSDFKPVTKKDIDARPQWIYNALYKIQNLGVFVDENKTKFTLLTYNWKISDFDKLVKPDYKNDFERAWKEYYDREYEKYLRSFDDVYADQYNFETDNMNTIIGYLLRDGLEPILGSNIVVHDEYHEFAKQPDKWTVEPDSSIEPYGSELVSPVFHDFNKSISALETVLKFIRNNRNYSTNSTTGLHINIGTFAYDEIDLLKLMLFTGNQYVLNEFGRTNNTYAVDNLIGLLGEIKGYSSKTISEINDIVVKNQKSKKNFFNFLHLKNKGYIEIRALGNHYSESPEKVVEMFRRFVRAIEIAKNPLAYRNEYLKKLSQFASKAEKANVSK